MILVSARCAVPAAGPRNAFVGDSLHRLGERDEVKAAQMAHHAFPDTAQVRGIGSGQGVQPVIGEPGHLAATVHCSTAPVDQATAGEPLDHAGQPARDEHSVHGEFTHPHLSVTVFPTWP